jgi:magnesium transporter
MDEHTDVVAANTRVVTARRYRADGRFDELDAIEPSTAVSEVSAPGDGFLWIGLVDPPSAELEQLRRELGLHVLAVQDAETGRQQPKVQWFDGQLFVVLWALHPRETRIDTTVSEVYLFARDGLLVSVERTAGGRRLGVADVLSAADPEILGMGSLGGVHAVVAAAVRGYLAVGASIEDELEALEDQVFDADQRNDALRIYNLRRQIGKVDRAVSALATTFAASQTKLEDYAARQPALVPYVLDVIEDLSSAARLTADQDAALDGVISTHENSIQIQQNIDSRKISAVAALLAIPAVVSGLYTIPNIPGSTLPYNWVLAVAVILGLEVWAFLTLRQRGWL